MGARLRTCAECSALTESSQSPRLGGHSRSKQRSEGFTMALKHIYRLTNLHFLGCRVTGYPDGSWLRDTLDFTYKDVQGTLQQVEDYQEIIKELSKTHGAGITATLTLEGDHERSQEEMDEMADAACELLAFATKNEVFWAQRQTFDEYGQLVSGYGRTLGARVRDFHGGWS